MLRKASATRIVTMDEAIEAVVMFMLAGRLIKLRIEIPGDASDQRRRAVWHGLGLVVKIQVVA